MTDVPRPEQLLQDTAWLNSLATRLANDRDDADDLVQEARIAAWRRQPDTTRPMRAWLTKVVRDLAGMKRRSDLRRTVRYALAEDAQVPVAPDELLAQMRLHKTGRAEDANLAGNVVIEFTLVGEPNVGGLLERVEIVDADTTISQQTIRDCFLQQLYALELDPPPDGVTIKRMLHLKVP